MSTAVAEEALEQLRQQARAISSSIWQPAVCQLAEASSRSERAFFLLRELLLSAEPELRYRGVVGLQEAGTVDPESLASFVQDRWEESETLLDPVFLQGLARVCGRLPDSHLQPILDEVWRFGGEALRCSTIPLLWKGVTTRGRQALEPALEDASPVVRAHLALELVEHLPVSVAFELLSHLVQDSDRQVRGAVAVGLMSLASVPQHPRYAAVSSPEYKYLFTTLEQDPDLALRGLLGATPVPPKSRRDATTTALELASELDTKPEATLQKLSPWLRLAGSWHRLKAVAEFSCHPEVAQAARALAALCDEEAPFSERLLRCIGSLARVEEGTVLMELKSLSETCLRIIEFTTYEELSQWAVARLKRNWPTSATLQCSQLYQAVQVVGEAAQGGTSGDLSFALLQVLDLRHQSASGPLPERELIEPALEHLTSLLQEGVGRLS